jgi:hypothetical protein
VDEEFTENPLPTTPNNCQNEAKIMHIIRIKFFPEWGTTNHLRSFFKNIKPKRLLNVYLVGAGIAFIICKTKKGISKLKSISLIFNLRWATRTAEKWIHFAKTRFQA